MPLPDVERVLYRINPLEQVICQLRYPTNLRIGAESPVDFQKRIRRLFPFYRTQSILSPLPDEIAKSLPPELSALFAPQSAGTEHVFSTEGDTWVATLTRDFIALTTPNYEKWEQFRDYLQPLLDAVLSIYEIPFFIRIGLRYQNIIRRSKLKLGKQTWNKLLSPNILGELGSKSVSSDVERCTHQIVIGLDEHQSKVKMQHGLVIDQSQSNNETCYLIDNDFFTTSRMEYEHVDKVLNYFNQQSRRLFHWCISEKLHAAMVPTPV